MLESRKMIRRRYVFFGQVQGVGFRYRARHAADHFACTGWIRNEYDGSVTMEIQGSADAIEQVLLSIERGTYIRIEDYRCKEIPVADHESGFHSVR